MARPIVVLAALVFVVSQAPAPDPVRPDPDAPGRSQRTTPSSWRT